MNLLRKLMAVVVITLALNFIAMAVVAGMLAQKARLDKAKLMQVKEILFPPTDAAEPEIPATEEPPPEPTPMEQLIALLDAQSGKAAEERIRDLSRTLDARAVSNDRSRRELADRARQLDAAATELANRLRAFAEERMAWEEKVMAARNQAADEGFQEALALYESLPAKQAKAILLGLENETILAFLREMEPRTAGKILREFKADDETQRAREVLELMRQGEPAVASNAGETAGNIADVW